MRIISLSAAVSPFITGSGSRLVCFFLVVVGGGGGGRRYVAVIPANINSIVLAAVGCVVSRRRHGDDDDIYSIISSILYIVEGMELRLELLMFCELLALEHNSYGI